MGAHLCAHTQRGGAHAPTNDGIGAFSATYYEYSHSVRSRTDHYVLQSDTSNNKNLHYCKSTPKLRETIRIFDSRGFVLAPTKRSLEVGQNHCHQLQILLFFLYPPAPPFLGNYSSILVTS